MRELEYLEWLYQTEGDLSHLFAKHQSKREEKIIEEFVKYIGGMNGLTTPTMRLRFESAFLHGHNSMVRFNYQNRKVNRELCDLMVISTLRENGRFTSQKVTFIQAKKGSKKLRRYSIDLAQLHLLSKFPTFEGKAGFFKNKKISFKNIMESLGSYLLFSGDEEFAWCTASAIKRELAEKKSLRLKDLGNLFSNEYSSFLRYFPTHPFHWRPYYGWSVESCSTLNRFLQAWSSFCLGELWLVDNRGRLTNAVLASLVKEVASKANLQSLNEAMAGLEINNVDDFLLDDANHAIGGVVSVVIDLGDG